MPLRWVVVCLSLFFPQGSCFVVLHSTDTSFQIWHDRLPFLAKNDRGDYRCSLLANGHRRNTQTVLVFAGFGLGDLARKLGKWVGEATHDSEWKKVPDAFLEGFEESEINARARNAKPMQEVPAQEEDLELLPSTHRDASNIEDAEIVSENKKDQDRSDGSTEKPECQ